MNVKNSKLEELYYHFSKSEKEGIALLLNSPLFNQTEVLVKIHEFLCELKPGDELDKAALYKYVYGSNSTYSDVKLRVYISKLTKLIEKFIIIKSIEEYPTEELNMLAGYFIKNHFSKNLSILFKNIPEIKFVSYEDFLIYECKFYSLKKEYINDEFPNDSEKVKESYETMMIAQKRLNLFQILKTQCDLYSLRQKYNFDRDNSFEKSIIDNFSKELIDTNKTLKAYYIVYNLYFSFEIEKFTFLKEMVLNDEEIEYEMTRKVLNAHLQNFCIRQVNNGNSEFLSHLFDIYQFSLRFYKVAGDLNSANFRNITYCAVEIGNLDWAQSFVENYHDKVNEDEKGNAYNFNLARIAFEKKDYKSAMRLLLRVTYEDAFYASTARILLIKCYYELNDEMPLVSCCSSLNQYLRRNKEFTKQRIDNNLHFIQFVKSIQNNRLKNNKKLFINLYDKIDKSTVVEKDWLKQKVKEISPEITALN